MNTIITERPENMSFSEYRRLRREQTLRERRRKKLGDLVYLASQIVEDPVTKTMSRRTYMPAVKTFDSHGNVRYVAMERKQFS